MSDPHGTESSYRIEELDTLDALVAELCRRANAAGTRAFVRIQNVSARRVLVRNARRESTSVTTASGIGVQVVDEAGRSAIASRDGLDPDAALGLVERALRTADRGGGHGDSVSTPTLDPLRRRDVPCDPAAFAALDLDAVAARLVEIEREITARVAGVSVRVSASAELDSWRIAREDGTDVTFAMPRCVLAMGATREASGARHAVSAALPTPDPACVWDSAFVEQFLARAEQAARLATVLPDAPAHPPGSFPLVIDYALAKGLAHEAFGHAAEADGFRSSVLARDGRFRRGERVGAEHVSIVDEPVAADHAWQPVSANGLVRRPVRIVERGRLADALSDPWSAGPAGVPISGAARAQSYRNAPLPRMTNIRLEVDGAHPAPGPFESYGPEQVRELLGEAGVFDRHDAVRYLAGYSGGQVNPTTGDFVFNCKAIYELRPTRIELYRPAIFSGSMFGALESVREAFGPLRLDALGYCGKWGQSVPSSGGSHYFVVIDPHPAVRLGGR